MTRYIEQSKLTDVIERMCDSYCKFPDQARDQVELTDICSRCPLNTILFDEKGGDTDDE